MARDYYQINTRKAVKNLLAYFDVASPAQLESGARWYAAARTQAQDAADLFGFPLDVCANVISTLSPQTRWEDNVEYAFHVLEFGSRPSGCMQGNFERASDAIRAHYAGEDFQFGVRAHKTRRFASAITDGGTGQSVVIDVHMLRVIIQGPDYVFRDGMKDDLAKIIKRVGVYGQCERAVQIAARRRGVLPCTMQAVAWLVVTENRGI